MIALRIFAIVLIVAGILALVYGGFSYTLITNSTNIGPVELAVHEENTVNIPIWAGIVAIVIGGGMLLFKK